MTEKATLATIDTKIDMYMASNDKAMTSNNKAIAAMAEAISLVSASQAESKAMQYEINALSGGRSEHSQDIKELRREMNELSIQVSTNTNTSEDLKEIRKEQRSSVNKVLGGLVLAFILGVLGLFLK